MEFTLEVLGIVHIFEKRFQNMHEAVHRCRRNSKNMYISLENREPYSDNLHIFADYHENMHSLKR